MQRGSREHSRSEHYGQRSADMWRDEFGDAAPVMHVNIQRKLLYNFKPQSCWKYTKSVDALQLMYCVIHMFTEAQGYPAAFIQKVDMKIIRVFIDHQIHTVPSRAGHFRHIT